MKIPSPMVGSAKGVNGRVCIGGGGFGNGLSSPVEALLVLGLCEIDFSSTEMSGVDPLRNVYGLTSNWEGLLILPKRCVSNGSLDVAMWKKSAHDENLFLSAQSFG